MSVNETKTRYRDASVIPIRRDAPVAPASDGELVSRALAGDESGAELLFRRYASFVTGLAYRLAGGRQSDVDDLVQDSLLKALEKLHQLRDPQSFAKWLGTIVVRTSRRHFRRTRLQSRFLSGGAARPIDVNSLVSPDAPPDVAAELRGLYAMLETLPSDERVALVLRRVQGLTIPEIAQWMGVSLSTVKRRLDVAEVKLARRIAP
ncbi:MAG: RNA polymerase sigma factor [Polyangiales bacterium]